MGSRQQRWLQAIQNRVQATSEMLKSMKEVRLGGLQNLMAEKLRGLRIVEVAESTPFKRALTLIVTFCESRPKFTFRFTPPQITDNS